VIAARLAELFRSLAAPEALRAQAREIQGAGSALFELAGANTKRLREKKGQMA
jgi:hypothetical protein